MAAGSSTYRLVPYCADRMAHDRRSGSRTHSRCRQQGKLPRPAPGVARHAGGGRHQVPSPVKASGDPPSGNREPIQRPAHPNMTALGHKLAGDDRHRRLHPRENPSGPRVDCGRRSAWTPTSVATCSAPGVGQGGRPDLDRWHGLISVVEQSVGAATGSLGFTSANRDRSAASRREPRRLLSV